MSWKRDLDELRREAFAQTVEDPTPTAEAKALAEEVANGGGIVASMPKIRAAAKSGIDLGLRPPPACAVYGWRVCLSRARFPNGSYSWQLSASLSPRGRRAVERDWKMLGRIVAHLGGPSGALVVPENPNDVHHWQWFEQVPS